MNTLELLYNKALMKQAADKAENVKKTKVWFILIDYRRTNYDRSAIVFYWTSRELQVGHLSAIPACVLGCPLQTRNSPETGFENETFFLTFPQEIFAFFS